MKKKLTTFQRMRRHRRGLRFMGFLFTLVGGLLVLSGIPLVADPNATLLVNGKPTTELGPKLSFVTFAGGFVVAGLFFLRAHARTIDRLFLWRESVRHAIFPWLRT